MNDRAQTVDVLVIGSGPAGSSAAAVLAEQGHEVLMLEREKFPRYRVGESLIPHCWFPLERLGLNEELAQADFVTAKHSVQFASIDGQLSTPFYFFEHSDHPSSRTWQVVRSEFDGFLRDHALQRGARLLDETAAKELIWEDGVVCGAVASGPSGEPFEVRARVTVDATGRDAFAQARNRWRVQDERLKKIAIWTYYEGALRDPGIDEGATTIAYLPDKGWFWYLPLVDNRVSVGAVADREYLYRDTRDPEQIFLREVEVQKWIQRHLEPGCPTGEFHVTSDFSYRSRHCAADGLVLAGDAFGFLDPVFSSGVFLALQGGVMAGDAIHGALEAGDVSAERFREYGERFMQGMEAMRRLVHAFYDVTFNFGEFLKAHPDQRTALTDVLIGDLFKDFDPLFEAVSEFAEVPGPLPHGAPLKRA